MPEQEEFIRHIKKCSLNDRESQKYIYETFYDDAKDICAHYASDSDELIEIINNCFLKIFKNIGQFKIDEKSSGDTFRIWSRKWIIIGVVDYCRNHFKHNLLIDFKHKLLSDHQKAWRNFINKICSQAGRSSFTDIMRSIRCLPDSGRIILNLAVLEEFSYQQIADCLNISVKTATENVLSAKWKLKNKLLLFPIHKEKLCIEQI